MLKLKRHPYETLMSNSQSPDLLVNEKGLYTLPTFHAAFEMQVWNKAVAWASKIMIKRRGGGDIVNRAQQILDIDPLVQALPQRLFRGQHMFAGVFVSQGFSGSSNIKVLPFWPTAFSSRGWGWEEMIALEPHQQFIRMVIIQHARGGQNWALNGWDEKRNVFSSLTKAQDEQAKVDSGLWSIKTPDHGSDLSQTSGLGVFLCDQQGYLNRKGHTSQLLSDAVLFESREAVVRSLKARSIATDYVIVRIENKLHSVVEHHGNMDYGILREGIAHREKTQLLESLKTMNVDQLQERIELLERMIVEKTGTSVSETRSLGLHDKPAGTRKKM